MNCGVGIAGDWRCHGTHLLRLRCTMWNSTETARTGLLGAVPKYMKHNIGRTSDRPTWQTTVTWGACCLRSRWDRLWDQGESADKAVLTQRLLCRGLTLWLRRSLLIYIGAFFPPPLLPSPLLQLSLSLGRLLLGTRRRRHGRLRLLGCRRPRNRYHPRCSIPLPRPDSRSHKAKDHTGPLVKSVCRQWQPQRLYRKDEGGRACSRL